MAASDLLTDDGVLRSLSTLLDEALSCPTTPQDNADTGHEDLLLEKPKKKHSGPRKRRPKKKKNGADDVDELVLSVDTSPHSDPGDANNLKSLCASAVPFVPPSSPSSPALIPLQELPNGTSMLVALPSPPLLPSPYHFHRSPHARPISAYLGDFGRDADANDRAYWTQYVIDAAEKERARRLNVLRQLQQEEEEEIRRRRAWAIAAIEQEQQAMMREMFLDNMKNTQWFQSTITRLDHDYEVVCPNSWFGCTFSCMLKDLETHLEHCVYRQVPDTLDQVVDESMAMDLESYDVVCPNAMLGCSAIFPREVLAEHLVNCPVQAMTREKEWEERQEWQQNVIEMTEEERTRRMNELNDQQDKFSFGQLQRLYEEQTAMMHVMLHDEIVRFANQCQVDAEAVRPAIEIAIERIQSEILRAWGENGVRVESYGSFATQLHGGHSDVDLVVFGAAGAASSSAAASSDHLLTSQECVSVLAAHLSSVESGMYSDISAITRATIPLVKVVVTVENAATGEDAVPKVHRIPFDITFDDPRDSSHNGIASATLLQTLMCHFYGLRELTLVLKHFLATRGLNDPYVGGLSSYGLVLMILFVLREQGALLSNTPSKEAAGLTIDVYAEAKDTVAPGQEACTSRYHMQQAKGVAIANEIIRQARLRQSSLMAGATKDPSRRPRRSETAAWEVLIGRSTQEPKPPVETSRASPRKSRSTEAFLLGKLLMDFLQWYGTDFRQNLDQIAVLSSQDASLAGGYVTSPTTLAVSHSGLSLSPLQRPPSVNLGTGSMLTTYEGGSVDPTLVIQDPLQRDNNVGKTCYRISQVLRDFSDFLSVLTALIVRGSVVGTGVSPRAESNEKAEVSPSQRILSSVFQMKQAPISIAPAISHVETNGG